MAALMFVTEFTGSASILMRPPDISSTMPFHARKCCWKMSLPAHPDWIFQVMAFAAGATVGWVPPATVAGAPDAGGAFCERHAVRNAPTPVSEPYFRKPRRDNLERKVISTSNPTGTARPFDSDRFTLSSQGFDR